jgi:hypothetical protein
MSKDTRIVQSCPSCKKRLHIRLKHVGKRVGCRHCLHRFKVRDPSSSFSLSDSGMALLNRVDEVLEQANPSMQTKNRSKS